MKRKRVLPVPWKPGDKSTFERTLPNGEPYRYIPPTTTLEINAEKHRREIHAEEDYQTRIEERHQQWLDESMDDDAVYERIANGDEP